MIFRGIALIHRIGTKRGLLLASTVLAGIATPAGATPVVTIPVGTTLNADASVLTADGFIDNGTLNIIGRSGPYAGTISGTGNVVLSLPSGTYMIFTGTNTYTGGTTIPSGNTLQLGEGCGAITCGGPSGSIVSDVVNNGTLTFMRSNTYEYSGAISGYGTVNQFGIGTVILTGTNNYTGDTNVYYHNTLQVGNGGTTGSLGNSSWVTVWDQATLIFNRSNSYTFAGSIGSSGSVRQIGSGTLIVTGYIQSQPGRSAYVGPGSTLQVGAGGVTGYISGDVVVDGTLTFNRSDIFRYYGTISGTGAVVQAGPGITILNGTNTYTGGTTILSGRLQLGEGGSSAVITGNVVNNGQLVIDNSDTITLSGDISGTGGISKIGFGTAILTGHLTYTGPTTVSNGVLIVGGVVIPGGYGVATVNDGQTLPLPQLNYAGTVVMNRSDTYTYSGIFAGIGSLQQAGVGTTILTGENTYAGGTTITAGTLQLGNGGTTGSVVGNIVDNGTLVFNHSDTVTFGGLISGSGALRQAGTGTLILTATNSLSGPTTVSSGTLVVGDELHPSASLAGGVTVASGATLRGHGTIGGAVTNTAGGTVMPGASIGTLTVAGYTQGPTSTFSMEVSPTAASSLVSTGPVSLDGALNVAFDAGTYSAAQYTIIQSSTSVSGRFASFSASGIPSKVAFGTRYSATGVSLVVEPAADGQIHSDFRRSTIDTAEVINDQIYAHQGTRYCHSEGQTGRAGEWTCPELSVWYQGFGGVGTFDANGDAAGFNSRYAGFIGGVDAEVEPGYTVGVTASYVRTLLGVSGGGAKASNDSFAIALIGDMPLFGGKLDAQVIGISSMGDAQRAPDDLPVDTARSHPKGNGFVVSAQYSRPLIGQDLMGLAGLTYMGSQWDSFRETGTSPYNFAVASKSGSSFYGDLGLKFGHIYHLRSGATLLPEVTAGVRGYFGAAASEATVNIAGAEGPSLAAPAVAFDRVAFVGGFNITAQRRDGFTLALHAQGRISGSMREATLGIEGRYPF